MFNGTFFDQDYFERGRQTGKSWYENYRWMPQKSFREALAFIDCLGLSDKRDYILDYGCGKGFLVRAFRELCFKADGCDISNYALSFAPANCWNCSNIEEWYKYFGSYTHIVCKDVLEHLNKEQLETVLNLLTSLAPKMVCVVPMGNNGKYRIPEYHYDISHIIIEDEDWWRNLFIRAGWGIVKETNHLPGLKDNWFYIPNGNHVFVLENP